MIDLSDVAIENFEETIIPAIKASVEVALRSYEQGAEGYRTNYNGAYTLSCTCWENLYNRLDVILENNKFFKKIVNNKVMKISFRNFDDYITFYISHVDKKLRIPKAGKGIKHIVQDRYFLCSSIEKIIARHTSSIYILGYDIDIEDGLGDVTFTILSYRMHNYQSRLIHKFITSDILPTSVSRDAEDIRQPIVTRDIKKRSIMKKAL